MTSSQRGKGGSGKISSLYGLPVRATRGGALFSAFPYVTKISPESVALFIAAHTLPGDTVFDGFSGSGTTGVGAVLCGAPPASLREKAKALGISAKWGPRRAVLCELGVLGSFVGRVLTSPPEPTEFRSCAEDLLEKVERRYRWMYEAADPSGRAGIVRHVVWSDVIECGHCGKEISLWEGCVSRSPARISESAKCPHCQHVTRVDAAKRKTKRVRDELLGDSRVMRVRVAAWVYGKSGSRKWSREANQVDAELMKRVAKEPLPRSVPVIPIPWGELYRSGYHQGISHLHHFYTRRNLIVFTALWRAVEGYPKQVQDALRFWLLGYNASHATIMTRVVAKQRQKDLVVTSAQPGVLYISGLPVEKNLFEGVRRRLKTVVQAFEITYGKGTCVDVRNKSCLSVDLPDASVDYVFTDPPFGGNIPYAEVNFINEAWLGRVTDAREEVTVSSKQGKSVETYCEMLTGALSEVRRILRKDGKATLVFHSSTAGVWRALQRACEKAGFTVIQAGILDKTQGSFKQVTANGSVRGDPILLLMKKPPLVNGEMRSFITAADKVIREAREARDPDEMTAQRLYSRLVAHCLARHENVPMGAREFYRHLAERGAADVRLVVED